MKAAVITKYGSPAVIHIRDVPRPKINEHEILVKVKATAVTAADARIRAARFPRGFAFFARLAFGLFRPRVRVLGGSFSGIVESVGTAVTAFRPGDEVCGMTGMRMGCHAEFVKIRADKAVVRKPAGVSHEEAAGVIFGGTTALYFLRDRAVVASGERVVVVGASGAAGTSAVQLARYFGASVDAVTSTKNMALVADLGAEETIDYTKNNFLDGQARFDVVFDATGTVSPARGRGVLKPSGRLILAAADLVQILAARHHGILVGTAPERAQDISFLLSLVAQKKLRVVITNVVKLDDIATAHQEVDTGHKVGNIVVRF